MAVHTARRAASVATMSIMGVCIRLGLVGVAGYLWWSYNIVLGNAVAIESLGLFTGLSDFGRFYLIPMAGSLSQLYWDEDLDLGVLRHPTIGIFAIVVGLFDILGPAYGFLITTERSFTLPNIVFALVWGFFFSVVCQEVMWRLARDIFDWARAQLKRS